MRWVFVTVFERTRISVYRSIMRRMTFLCAAGFAWSLPLDVRARGSALNAHKTAGVDERAVHKQIRARHDNRFVIAQIGVMMS